MIYSYKISRAIGFAIKTHEVDQKQKRKGKDIPYITHPLTVGLILSQVGADENVVVAGILHDTIEDSVALNKVTSEILAQIFGQEVADLVLSVTEQNKALPWADRKREALEHVNSMSHDSLLLKSADIIANATELIDDHEREGDKVFERFNASKADLLQNLLRLISAITGKWPENPLADDLGWVAGKVQMMGAVNFMIQHPATIIEYRDYDENMPIECFICGWKGTPKSSDWIDTDSHYSLNVHCPKCEKMLIVASYPYNNGTYELG